ncbi:MAG: pantoate--beta-alanine ligase [Ferruginibacter sp.]
MIIIKHIKDLDNLHRLHKLRSNCIGFVPTMGALHDGHISLIKAAKQDNDIAVCSIFVNPTQFNNKNDFKKYPVTIENDINKLEKASCDVLFLPSVEEMYPPNEKSEHYQLGELETVLEGKYRPGHFQGVCIIVDKLLQAVKPNGLYLGKKDYQQCMVIKKMMSEKKYSIELNVCETVREKDGLAMSSRNIRLNEVERQKALQIIACLNLLRAHIKEGSLASLKEEATFFLEKNGFKVDYTEIADANTLEIINQWDGKRKPVALVAAYLNEVRLIDNIIL